MAYRDLDPDQALAELQQDPELRILDVRTEPEHRQHRLPNAVLIPVQDLAARFEELDPDAKWLVHCEHGVRSVYACEFLGQAGFARLANLRGGIAHWIGRGLPVETAAPDRS